MQKDQFYPDIETKFDQLLVHMSEKNKVTDEIVKILKQLCNIENFYSSAFDKLANSVSKLLVGKDPYKDILIIFQRMLASKSEQSEKIAQSIKDDMIPFILASVDSKAQQIFRDKQKRVKETRAKMQRKIRSLYQSQNQFKRSISDIKNLPTNVSAGEKQKAFNMYKKKQINLNDTIDVYNANIDEYMLKYSEMCEQLSEIETKRKINLRDAVSKFMIFEMDSIKNIEYNIARYMESLNKMEEKLIIQDRIIVGGTSELYDGKEGGVIQLAKLSNKNYIHHIQGIKQIDHFIPPFEKKFSEIKKNQVPGQITPEHYHELLVSLFPLLDYANSQLELNILRQVCVFSMDFYMDFYGNKVTVLSGLLCHVVFNNENVWKAYSKRVRDKIKKEEGATQSNKSDRLTRLRTLLQGDMNLLKEININKYITEIIVELQTITERSTIRTQSVIEENEEEFTVDELECLT